MYKIPLDLLDDIGSRFLLDAPDKELEDPISLCFLTELAYWFYLDEYVEEDDSLNKVKFDVFATQILTHLNIKPQEGTIEEMIRKFKEFKIKVPTYGAALLTTDLSNILLVQGFWQSDSWGFPKGKINEDESPMQCAIREVLEETSYDISSKISEDNFIEASIGEQKVRLYVIPGVSMETKFIPKTKGEIKKISWFPISGLVGRRGENLPGCTPLLKKWFLVSPFVRPLREWIAGHMRKQVASSNERSRSANAKKAPRKRHQSLNLTTGNCKANASTEAPGKNVSTWNSSFSGNVPLCDDKQKRLNMSSSPHKLQARCKSTKNRNQSFTENETLSDKTGKKIHQSQEQVQRFTFKKRAKNKNPGESVIGTENPKVGPSSTSSNEFISYTWNNFKINELAIKGAIDKVFSNITLQAKG